MTRIDRTLAALAVLTLVGLGLRIAWLGQDLFGDEIYTYDIITDRGPREVLNLVRDTSVTPPLHYLLAWVAVQLGDPEMTQRLPSLILGTATIPLVYWLGASTIGRGPGLVAAGILALDPFAIFYGSEGRAYATLAFFVVLAALSLVRVLDPTRRHPREWWGGFVLAAVCAMYTHYTGLFPLLALGLWALWAYPEKRKAVLLASAAAVVLYLPWIPAYLDQRSNEGIEALETLAPFTLDEVFVGLVKNLVGLPFTDLEDVPGIFGLVALGAAVGAGVMFGFLRGFPPAPRRDLVVVAGLALATIVGVVLYGLAGQSIYAPRTLFASLPGIALLLGWLVWRTPYWALGLLALAILTGTVTAQSDDYRRPAFSEVAKVIERDGDPDDPVVMLTVFPDENRLGRGSPLQRSLDIHLDEPQDIRISLPDDRKAYTAAYGDARARNGRLFFVIPGLPGLDARPTPPKLPASFKLVKQQVFDGLAPVGVFEYEVR